MGQFYYVAEGEVKCLNELTNRWGESGDVVLKLFTATTAEGNHSATWAAFTEASFAGYAEFVLDSWDPATHPNDTVHAITSPEVAPTFDNDETNAEEVLGAAIVDNNDSTLICWGYFIDGETPVSIPAESTFTVNMSIRDISLNFS